MGSEPARTAGPRAMERSRGPVRRRGSPWRRAAFVLGLVLLLLATGSARNPTALPSAPPAPLAGHCAPTAPATCSIAPPPTESSAAPPVRWSNLTSTVATAPTPRSFAAVAYDPSLGAVVLFGGRDGDGAGLADTWTFDASGWHLHAFDGSSPSPRWGAAMAYDDHGGGLLLFGGIGGTGALGDTWVLNGSGWHEVTTSAAPTPRAFGAAVYDPTFGRVLLFGGGDLSGAAFNDTWIFSGGSWQDLSLALGAPPASRLMAAATYDAPLGSLLLYGGSASYASNGAYADTWALEAAGWRNVSAVTGPWGPGPRAGGALAEVDAVGGAVLVGGAALGGSVLLPPSGTWVYTGGGWSDATARVGVGPTPRAGSAFVYDPALREALLFGGATPAAPLGDTWSLGSASLEIAVTIGPTAGAVPLNSSFSVVCTGGTPPYAVNWSFGDGGSADGTLNATHVYGLAGNYSASVTVTDAAGGRSFKAVPIEALTPWEGGHQWTNVGRGLPDVPSARHDAQITFDPGLAAAILFGGESPSGSALGDTWEFVNNVWIDLSSGSGAAPPPRWGGTLVADPIDGTIVLFGGTDGSRYLNDTWTFNGSGWSEASGTAPSPRAFAQAAFDSYDGYVLLFGGTSAGPTGTAGAVNADTWAYRGGVWRNLTSQLAIAPPPTTGGVAVYDPADLTTVLFGGSSVAAGGAPGTCYPNGATWRFSGGAWTADATTRAPAGELQPAATYDTKDRLVLLFGGSASTDSGCVVSAATWSYVGGSWSNLSGPTLTVPPARDGAAMTFDAAEGVVLMFGGNDAGLLLNDTWVFPTELNATSTTVSGNGTSLTGGSSGGTGGTGGSGGSGGSGGAGSGIPFAVGYTLSSAGGTGPLTISFTATYVGGTAPVSFSWYFGDSSPMVNGSVVTHVYTVPGSYDPVLTATDAAGEVVVRVLATIQVAGNAPPVLTSTPAAAQSVPALTIAASALAVGAGLVAATALLLRRKELSQKLPPGGGRNA